MSTNKKIVSSLEGVSILPGRAVGNTTRIIDNAVQLLFRGEVVKVEDHYKGSSMRAIDNLAFRIMERISNEHHHDQLIYNPKDYTLRFKSDHTIRFIP